MNLLNDVFSIFFSRSSSRILCFLFQVISFVRSLFKSKKWWQWHYWIHSWIYNAYSIFESFFRDRHEKKTIVEKILKKLTNDKSKFILQSFNDNLHRRARLVFREDYKSIYDRQIINWFKKNRVDVEWYRKND